MKVLLLNASEEVLKVIAWQRAVKLLMAGKARKPYGHDEEYEIKTSSGVFYLPTAIVLVQYIHVPYRNVAVNKSNVLARDNYACAYCGKRLSNSTGTVDHVTPQSRGGKHEWTNVVASCRPCNNKKDSLTLVEVGKKYGIHLKVKPHVPSRNIMVLTGIDVKTHETWTKWIEI
ncbi:MAG: HNH endonuclease [Candidatus Lokiarchaeota archaeon]|nr:HNH endonuclease [Candidatus Lokiarchaeota archaeon]